MLTALGHPTLQLIGMTSKMLIDKVPIISPRPKEMQVLVLGMSRTG